MVSRLLREQYSVANSMNTKGLQTLGTGWSVEQRAPDQILQKTVVEDKKMGRQ